jgi:hypothetical protein
MFRGGIQPEPKLILDAAAHGSLMALSPKDAIDIINKMTLNDRAAKHNRKSPQKKSEILELGTNGAILAQLEEIRIQMKEMPK